MADSDINLETILEQLEFNYGGVLQELARLHDTVVEQMEVLKTAGVKIRRKSTTYATGTVLVCVGKNNGNKRLKCKFGGTTSEETWTEATYNSLVIGNTYSDGTVTWEVMEEAFTSSSIVESAMEASHASTADSATSAAEAGYALSAGYIGPFQVINLGTATSSGSETPGGPVVTSTGINYQVLDATRNWVEARAGNIVNGEFTIPVPYNSGFLPDGRTLYLQGSSSDGQTASFAFGYIPPQQIPENQFLTALAHNSGGKVQQIQFGDIVTPWPGSGGQIIGSKYNGPFKISIVNSTTVSSGGSEYIQYNFTMTDPTAPLDATSRPEWAGRVFAGESHYRVAESSGTMRDGDWICLVGNSSRGSVTFSCLNSLPTGGLKGSFVTRLAKNEGGKIVQIQYGDITVPPWKVTFASSANVAILASSAYTADFASRTEYFGPFHVSTIASEVIPGPTEEDPTTTNFIVKVIDDTRQADIAGAVVYESNTDIAMWSNNTTATLTPGERLYLVGTSDSAGIGLNFSSGTAPSSSAGQFWTQLAYNNGARIIQAQFGDIVEPWKTEAQQPLDVSTYNGPFFVNADAAPTAQNAVHVIVCDLTDPRPQGSGIAGKVFDGETLWEVTSSGFTVQDGGYVYLNGTKDIAPIITTTIGTNDSSHFSIKIAKNVGGVIKQIQYGDVYSIPCNAYSADSASHASTADSATSAEIASWASSAGYKGPFTNSVTSVNSSTLAVNVDVWNPLDISGSTVAGHVFDGQTLYDITNASFSNLVNGAFVYLNGTSGSTPVIATTSGNNNASQFSIKLAKNEDGKMVQIQYGDVYSIPWNTAGGGVQKIIAGPGTEISPLSGTGEVTISCTITGGTSVLPVDWKGSEIMQDGIRYWTGDSASTPSGLKQIGDGFGGIIIGTARGPSSYYDYDKYDEDSSYSLQIWINPGGPSPSLTRVELLRPLLTQVDVSGSSGECFTPRGTGVYIPIPIDTEFEIKEFHSAGGATHFLKFYPYHMPIQELEEEP